MMRPVLMWGYWKVGLFQGEDEADSVVMKVLSILLTFVLLTVVLELLSRTKLRFVLGK